eukprot:scaffold93405_cov28-Prasinocladus_malaysianus.AAC.5
MTIIGGKCGVSGAFIGQKSINSHGIIGAKHGAAFNRPSALSIEQGIGLGDLGGGKSAPGNTRNAVANGSRARRRGRTA